MKKKWIILGYLLSALIPLAPLLFTIIGAILAEIFQCSYSAAGKSPCMVLGVDIGGFIGNAVMLHWFIPLGFGLFLVFLLPWTAVVFVSVRRNNHRELINAIKNNDFDNVAHLTLVTSVNGKDKQGNTALIHASGLGHIDIVELLLESGAKTNLKNKEGVTALAKAIEKNHSAIVKLLQENSATK